MRAMQIYRHWRSSGLTVSSWRIATYNLDSTESAMSKPLVRSWLLPLIKILLWVKAFHLLNRPLVSVSLEKQRHSDQPRITSVGYIRCGWTQSHT